MIVDDTLIPLASVGSVVTPHFNFFFFLFSLSHLKKYRLVHFIVDISTPILLLLIFNFYP
jgi:hypothetical protein